ncbi:MAG: HAMP domain-containing histidine kinase [Bacteroidetes bacterium]|nr:HAMP domain-containing histidine kinase [Bacteroidota bacterium]
MHFFSRYRYIWKFPQEQEDAYDRFVQPSNLISFRLVTFITLFGMSLFLIIDYFRVSDFSVVLASRAIILSIAATLMTLSFKPNISARSIRWGVAIIAFLNFSGAMVTATFGKMPPYYITNLLFLILVLVVTASGLSFRNALLLNAACFLVFIVFSQFIKREPFYFTQYPHLIVVFLYIHIVGIVLENRRRINFIQFTDLEKQKKIVEDLNQQKNKIISILSHDLAVPMNSLSILLHLQRTQNIKGDELQPFLNDVGNQLNNVTSLLQNLVRWSRSQMEGFTPEMKLLNLHKHLEEDSKLFQRSAADKDLRIIVHSDDMPAVFADEEMVRIAIRNLISNAIKFAYNGTDVKIHCFITKENKVRLTVENMGMPIPLPLREKLFTFQMPSLQDTNGAKGTGLGLAVAAYFVKINDGKIFIEQKDDENVTCFGLEFNSAITRLESTKVFPEISSDAKKARAK